MAVGDDEHDDNLERDAGLVRLLGIAGEEAPPPALDAAILAAARRAAHAQPQGSRSSGASQPPRVSATRRWYAPVSIAAVLVVSVSLVTVVYREQGDELIQPSPGVPAPTAARVPDSASAGVQGPKLESPGTLPHAERGDAEKRETAPAQPQFAEDNNAGRAAKLGAASREPDSPKERPAATDKAAILAQSAATAPGLRPESHTGES